MSIVPYKPPKHTRKNQPLPPHQIILPPHFQDETQYWKERAEALQKKLDDLENNYDELKHLKIIADALSFYCFNKSRPIHILNCARIVKNNQCKGCVNRTSFLKKIC